MTKEGKENWESLSVAYFIVSTGEEKQGQGGNAIIHGKCGNVLV